MFKFIGGALSFHKRHTITLVLSMCAILQLNSSFTSSTEAYYDSNHYNTTTFYEYLDFLEPLSKTQSDFWDYMR